MRALKFSRPLLISIGLAAILFQGLSKDPSRVPSPLIDKAVPAFELPQLSSAEPWSPSAYAGQVWLLNVWGSWCAACTVEHSLLNELAANKTVAIVGMAWKDKPKDSRAWLVKHGNPYAIVVTDTKGTVAIDLGVYGAPESYLIDKHGMIRFKQIGPFSPDVVRDTLMPLIEQLNAKQS